MNKLITIKTSELKHPEGKNEYLFIVDQDDDHFSCWDSALYNSLMKNSTVEIEFEVNKKGFRNITAVEAKIKEDLPALQAEFSPQETGMFYKEIGEMIRAGLLKDTNPVHKALKMAYFIRMKLVIGITVEDKINN